MVFFSITEIPDAEKHTGYFFIGYCKQVDSAIEAGDAYRKSVLATGLEIYRPGCIHPGPDPVFS